MDENLMKKNNVPNMKKTKEGTVDGNLLCFLKVVTNVVCLLERYGGLGNDGAKLGGFNV
jgi:hypothetical protein